LASNRGHSPQAQASSKRIGVRVARTFSIQPDGRVVFIDRHGRPATLGAAMAGPDSSALVKLVVAEPESMALRRAMRREPRRASCALARVEVIRAVRPHGAAAVTRARRLLRRLDLVQLDDELLDAAAWLDGGVPRSLDAIHLAAARTLGDELTAVVTYDGRMSAAADLVGLTVGTPR
jgi:predicted nucleic acid-binding protein